jgi:hypothetical protein
VTTLLASERRLSRSATVGRGWPFAGRVAFRGGRGGRLGGRPLGGVGVGVRGRLARGADPGIPDVGGVVSGLGGVVLAVLRGHAGKHAPDGAVSASGGAP